MSEQHWSNIESQEAVSCVGGIINEVIIVGHLDHVGSRLGDVVLMIFPDFYTKGGLFCPYLIFLCKGVSDLGDQRQRSRNAQKISWTLARKLIIAVPSLCYRRVRLPIVVDRRWTLITLSVLNRLKKSDGLVYSGQVLWKNINFVSTVTVNTSTKKRYGADHFHSMIHYWDHIKKKYGSCTKTYYYFYIRREE